MEKLFPKLSSKENHKRNLRRVAKSPKSIVAPQMVCIYNSLSLKKMFKPTKM